MIRSTRLCVPAVAMLLLCAGARGAVTTDGSLGVTAQSLLGPHYAIDPTIGKLAGRNLFFSFDTFAIAAGESATFSSGSVGAIDNIIGRVTGGSASTIDGLLRSTVSGADLYLLNPAGVLFGSGATLDVQGGLHVSTADYLKFADGREFSSLPGSTDELLSVAPPEAFGFLRPNPAAIALQQADLAVSRGNTLSLIGGPITISGSATDYPSFDSFPQDTALRTEQGRVNIVSVAATGEVRTTASGIEVAAGDEGGSIRIENGALIDVSGSGGGAIYLSGGDVQIANSLLRAQTVGADDGGVIDVAARQLTMTDSALDSSTYGPGSGGDIHLEVANDLAISGQNRRTEVDVVNFSTISSSGLLSRTFLPSIGGDAGNVSLSAATISVLDGAVIDTTTYGAGRGGDIDIDASSRLLVSGENRFASVFGGGIDSSGIVAESQSLSDLSADAGSIVIRAGSVEILDGARLSTVTYGLGNGGDLSIHSTGSARLSGTGPVSGLPSTISLLTFGVAQGKAGDLALAAHSIEISEGATIISLTRGVGAGGAIDLVADEDVVITGGQRRLPATITANSEGFGGVTGSSGRISIAARNISVVGGSRIESATQSDGDSAGIVLRASDTVRVSGGGSVGPFFLESALTTASYVTGAGGDIEIHAGKLLVADAARISSISLGSGATGDIRLFLDDSLTLEDGLIEASAAISDGGNITILANELLDLQGSEITTAVGNGEGQGGNIVIDPQFVVLDQSRIIANAFGGDGGNITISAGNFFSSPDSLIEASSALRADGNIVIASPDEDVSDDVDPLRTDIVLSPALLQQPCAERSGADVIGLYVKRNPQLQDSPYGLRSSVRSAGRDGDTPTTAQADRVAPSPTDRIEQVDLNNATKHGVAMRCRGDI